MKTTFRSVFFQKRKKYHKEVLRTLLYYEDTWNNLPSAEYWLVERALKPRVARLCGAIRQGVSPLTLTERVRFYQKSPHPPQYKSLDNARIVTLNYLLACQGENTRTDLWRDSVKAIPKSMLALQVMSDLSSDSNKWSKDGYRDF